MSTLKISQLCKTYPSGKQATRNVDIDIESGEFVVFVGPSGCGKSTLLRMVAGLEDITSGEILLGDRKINDLEPAERDIAMVFQNYALYPHMTVYKNLAYGLVNRNFSKPEIEKRVNSTAKMLQLDTYLKNKPSELSGGQRQRVAMGRAIVREPKLFLFDEPLSNLDAKLRNTMRLEIKSLQRRLNITAIYVTHDQVEAMTMADKIVILNDGEVEQIGTPQEIYHQPANLFVATFIGSPAMNVIDATIVDSAIQFDADHRLKTNINMDGLTHDQTIKVGFRPECVHISKEAEDFSVPLKVNIVEDLGAQRVIHGQIGDQQVTLVTEHTDIEDQHSYYAVIPSEHLYLFDPETGERKV